MDGENCDPMNLHRWLEGAHVKNLEIDPRLLCTGQKWSYLCSLLVRFCLLRSPFRDAVCYIHHFKCMWSLKLFTFVLSLYEIENFVVSDLLIGVPVSFLFPTIGFNTIYRKSGKQERRMEDRDPEEDWRRNPLLSRLDFFFRSLELDDPSCQQKLICELVQRPDKFSPISDLLMSIFR